MISTNEKNSKKTKKNIRSTRKVVTKSFLDGKLKEKFLILEKMILIGIPHTAMRDAWYALLAVWALDLKVNFFWSSLGIYEASKFIYYI